MFYKNLRMWFAGTLLLAPLVMAAQQNDPGGMPTGPAGASGNTQGSANGQMTPGISRSNRPVSDLSNNGEGGGPDAQLVRDKMFLRKAAEGGLAEVKLGQLAADRGGSDEVKSFGRRMVEDHTKLNETLKPFGDAMGMILPKTPAKPQLGEYAKLSALSGIAFDQEYLAYMSRDHHMDLREFRLEAASTTDQELKDAVVKGRMLILEDTRMVDKLAVANGIAVPHPAR